MAETEKSVEAARVCSYEVQSLVTVTGVKAIEQISCCFDKTNEAIRWGRRLYEEGMVVRGGFLSEWSLH